MKIYVDIAHDRAFTRKALEEKVLEIVTDCTAFHKTYDDFFGGDVPNMIDFLYDNNLLTFDELETKIINEEYEKIEDIREEYIDWCYQTYLDILIHNVLNEVELFDN